MIDLVSPIQTSLLLNIPKDSHPFFNLILYPILVSLFITQIEKIQNLINYSTTYMTTRLKSWFQWANWNSRASLEFSGKIFTARSRIVVIWSES